jgi:hypothetical protein
MLLVALAVLQLLPMFSSYIYAKLNLAFSAAFYAGKLLTTLAAATAYIRGVSEALTSSTSLPPQLQALAAV